MICGLNCDPGNFEDYDALARDLKAAGATVARFPLVLHGGVDYPAVCSALIGGGVEPLPVLARESFEHGGVRSGWKQSMAYWRDRLPMVTRWQVGNEPDHESPSSWTLAPDDFSDLLLLSREVFGPDAYLIAGGLVSGQPGYLD